MGTWVIQRDDGAFVTRGSKHSYTRDLTQAHRYMKREEAERDLCYENEKIVLYLEAKTKTG